MNTIANNFKKMTLFTLVGSVMALVIITGTLTPYASIEGYAFKLITVFPIGGIIIILAALMIIAGVAFGKKIVSLIGSGVALITDIVIPFFMKTESFYNALFGQIEGADELASAGQALGEALLGQEAMDEINEAYKEELLQEIKEAFHFGVGFYLILIGSILAVAAFAIAIIKINKAKALAGNFAEGVSSFAENIVENTVNEQEEEAEAGAKTFFKQSKEPWVCPACNETNESTSEFCVFCGETRPKPKTCYNCGTVMEDHMMFCPKCGTKYDEEKVKEKIAEEEREAQKPVCKYCGAKLPEGASFCGKCGKQQ